MHDQVSVTVFLGDVEVSFDDPNATLADLKEYLDEEGEICVIPERQRLFYMGYELKENHLKVKDIVSTYGTKMFSLVLTRAPGKLPARQLSFLLLFVIKI